MPNDSELGVDLDALLRAADPVGDDAVPDPDGPAALRIRTQARLRARRGRIRRLVVVPTAAALALGGATAGALALMENGQVSITATLECVHPSGEENSITGFPIALTAADAELMCRRHWETIARNPVFGDDRPGPVEGPITACAPSDGHGGVRVYAGDPETCEEHGDVPYTGPSDEQKRLADFAQDLPDDLRDLINPENPCPSFPALEARLNELLAAHDLADWSVEDAAPETNNSMMLKYFNEDGSTCAALSYQEDERTIFTQDPIPD